MSQPPLPSPAPAASAHVLPKPLFLALIVGLDNTQGHQYDYGRAVQAAVARLGWEYRAAVPLTARLGPLPVGWTAALDRGQYRFTGNVWAKARSIWRLGVSIATYLRRARPAQQRAIVFVEFFNDVQLLSLLLGLLRVPRRGLALWLVYRLPIYRERRRRIYQVLTALLRQLLGARALRLLTDSELLADSLARWLGQSVHVLPVPHSQPAEAEVYALPAWPAGARPRCVAWWPGRPAQDKGLQHLQRLVSETGPQARTACLVVAEGAGLSPTPGGCQVLALPDALPRDEYWGWLHAADLIVLPYLSEWYGERTSGIFIEAIVAGKPTAVSAGTWMAREALAYGLPELIIDWHRPGLWEQLLHLAADVNLRPRLAALQAAYQQRHSLARYAEAVRQVAAQ